MVSFKKGSRDKKRSRGKKSKTKQTSTHKTPVKFSNLTDNWEGISEVTVQFTGTGSRSCTSNARSWDISPSGSNSLSLSQTHFGILSLWWFMTLMYLTSTKSWAFCWRRWALPQLNIWIATHFWELGAMEMSLCLLQHDEQHYHHTGR